MPTTNRHQRHVDVQGTSNFRDIGGYLTADGLYVSKYKHFYRSDELSHVTPEAARMLHDKLKIAYTIDLRSVEEVKHAPYSIAGIERVSIPICPESFFELVRSKSELTEKDAVDLLTVMGTPFLTDFKLQMKAFFDTLLTKVKGTPCVLHCTAGKDRTGMATALLLYALGVPESTIRDDYLLTNEYVQHCSSSCVVGKCRLTVEATNVLLRAQVEFYDSAIAGAKKTYGSIDKYLQKELDLTAAKIDQLKTYYIRKTSAH